MFYTYVIQNKETGGIYIGYTNDLVKRIKEHNQGLNKSTKPHKSWQIIYYEACLNESDAKRREHYFKTSTGKRLIKLRLREYLHNK